MADQADKADKADQAAPVASVVITNHNYGRYVGAAIRSALEQTANCEVIVVDDGSTDGSRVVIEQLCERMPTRVRLVAKGNGGQASAINAGWAAATAPVVFFLDADDTLDRDAIERVVTELDRRPDAVRCQFRLRWIDERGGPIPGGFPETGRLLPSGDLRSRMGTNPDDIAWQPTSGNAFTAEVLEQLLPMPEEPYRISADHYLSNVSALHGPIAAIDAELGAYRIHGRNADHRAAFDLHRAREILRRTAETHRHLIDHGDRLGLVVPDSPDGYHSLTNAGLRLASFRLDDWRNDRSHDRNDDRSALPGAHPFPQDDRITLARRGVTAAWRRSDFTFVRRLAAIVWIALLAVAPRRFVAPIAAAVLTR